jgi:hypothetical protein
MADQWEGPRAVKSFIIGALASAFVAILYGWLIAQREEAIRRWLKRSTGGVIRRLYVRALVEAVRGGAGVADARHLAVLIVLVLLVAGAWARSQVNDIELRIQLLRQDTLPKSSVLSEEDRSRRLQQEREDLRKEVEALAAESRWPLYFARGLSFLLLGCAAVGWFAWLPYVLMRRRFAHEIARFSLRIQGLATVEELASLTKAELGVRNPVTLQAYVAVMKHVATRHGMPGLTQTFELWGDGGLPA